ncbi:MAG: carboxypeptidase regulatory-like domain-containing protein [Acidobacteria bacterium]|nr:carboxypeptidase regulatory-like domain-containing protein [Acidobacteriota bacterium]
MNHHTWERNNISGAKRKLMVLVLACLLPTVMIPALSEAQDFFGFRGRITDPSAAIISGAAIKVTEEKSGLTKSTVSNELGEYELRGIFPGTYTMEVETTEFKKYQNKGVIVYGRDVRRVDVKLELGEVSTTVTSKSRDPAFPQIRPRSHTKRPTGRSTALICRT